MTSMTTDSRPARVLVVDDEPDHGVTVKAILARDAIGVALAEDSAQALELARRQPFELAIVDLRLPGRDGLSTMHALRQLQPAMRFVILTAYPTPATCRLALTEGAAAYLEKPCSPEGLRALVATLVHPPAAG